MLDKLKALLDYCESVIDPKDYQRRIDRNIKCLNYEELDSPYIRIYYPIADHKPYSMEEIHSDIEKMMYNELVTSLPYIESVGTDGLPMLRAN